MVLKRNIARIIPDAPQGIAPPPPRPPSRVFSTRTTGTRIYGRDPIFSPALGGGIDRRDIKISPVGGIFSVGEVFGRGPPARILRAPAGPAPVQKKKEVPPVAVRVPLPSPPVMPRPSTTVGGLPTTKETSMDLGNILEGVADIYGTYVGARAAAGAPVGMADYRTDIPNFQSGWETSLALNEPGGGIPGFDVIAEPPGDDTKGMVYKKVCGQWKWVKQKRRRRRKLLTESDYNGLLKIQTLKNNQNMQIAIAKALGR